MGEKGPFIGHHSAIGCKLTSYQRGFLHKAKDKLQYSIIAYINMYLIRIFFSSIYNTYGNEQPENLVQMYRTFSKGSDHTRMIAVHE